MAAAAGFDALFIDLEHSALSVNDASQLCTTGLLAGVTPFVRVPYQCGDGMIQRVLDGGAMGVVFPHVSTRGTYARTQMASCAFHIMDVVSF